MLVQFLGDLHEGMTAIGSPPATYGEAPQWLVQQLLTRSPPFATGSAHPKTTRFSLEGVGYGTEASPSRCVIATRKVSKQGLTLSPSLVCLQKDRKAREMFTRNSLNGNFFSIHHSAGLSPAPTVCLAGLIRLSWEIVEFSALAVRFSPRQLCKKQSKAATEANSIRGRSQKK